MDHSIASRMGKATASARVGAAEGIKPFIPYAPYAFVGEISIFYLPRTSLFLLAFGAFCVAVFLEASRAHS